MICYLFSEPVYFFFTSGVPTLLYYAYIPTTVIALFVGLYVFWNGRHLLLNRLFLTISLLFSVWTVSDLIEWTNIHSNFILFVWNFQGVLLGLMAILCIYFIYVFLDKKDVLLRTKIIFLSLLAPIFILTPTVYLSGFDITDCDAFKFAWRPFEFYYTLLGVLAMVWILVLLIRRYRTAVSDLKKQIVLMGVGIELFIFVFSIWTSFTYYLSELGVLPDSSLEMYGMLGMIVFMVYISILMVRFKTFNAKLIATQALVWALVIIIGSEFFFTQTNLNVLLTAITLIISAWLGLAIVRSVKKEIKQEEELTRLNIDLQNVIKQRESLMHLINHKVKGSFTHSKYIFSGLLDGMFGEITPAVKKIAQMGLDSDTMGIRTIDLILNAANLESGTIKYDMKPVDLKDLTQKIIAEKKSSIEEKGITLETSFVDENDMINGDIFWLKEIVNNLLENAFRYTEHGKITIDLQKQKNKILLSVKDTGIGLTDEDKKSLFTEGGRGKDSVKFNVDSTGYGLYSVKLITEAHKGRVWAESEGKDKGSEFFVEFDAI